ncbi:hypothetical protein Tco_1261757 [Tanacetum coccineum]
MLPHLCETVNFLTGLRLRGAAHVMARLTRLNPDLSWELDISQAKPSFFNSRMEEVAGRGGRRKKVAGRGGRQKKVTGKGGRHEEGV